ncbi:hypothetical protein A1O1_06093 [Capronia coronata CBS 617.96]|uniref:Uncharacterized protein n=1 Tax=Capronia coronata CBS 617.96 TaxID=1182541 RepID=W9Y7W1_9EURO|nr:uncharacterized protein A1O1_06093 [Capronia coronata CBS 617.96]EXJ85725.1 hypothetical protein A1O1_06093 [Capronia coronata CBS 617.96]
MAHDGKALSSVRDLAVDVTIRTALSTPDITAAYRAGVETFLRRGEEADVLSEVRSLEFEASVWSRVTQALTLAAAGWDGNLTQLQIDTMHLLVAALDNAAVTFGQSIWLEEAQRRAINMYECDGGLFVRMGTAPRPMAGHGQDRDQGMGEEGEDGEEEEEEEEEEESKSESEETSAGEDGAASDGDGAADAGRSNLWVCQLYPNHRGCVHKSSLVRHMWMVHNVFGFKPQ